MQRALFGRVNRAARGARCRRLRGCRPGRARAAAARSRSTPAVRRRPAGGRRRRSPPSRTRPGRRHGGRVRLGDEGLRRPARDGRGAPVLGGVRDVTELLRRARPGGRAGAAAADPGRLPGRLPPEPRPGSRRPAARAAARDPRGRAGRDRRARDVLRLGRDLQPRPAARPRASWASARRARSWPPSPTSLRPPTPAARSSWRRRFGALGRADLRIVHPAELVAEAVYSA